MGARRKIFATGDVFYVSLENYGDVLGVVLLEQGDASKYLACGFSLKRDDETSAPLCGDDLIAVSLITPENLERGRWPVVGKIDPIDPRNYVELNAAATKDFIGVPVVGGGVIHKFLDACVGSRSWTSFADPEFLISFFFLELSGPKGRSLRIE
jgi:hypothetical protein